MIINETKKLINSLSMNEKRYFKIFVNKNIFGNQNKYLLIFDIFNRKDEVDEDSIREIIKKNNFSDKNISYDMNYLNKLILRSLNEFHFDKTVSLKLQNHIKSIEILFYKGLYDECLKIIQKAKKLNSKNESEILMLELLNWEKKCMGYSKGFQGALSINKKIDEYFLNIKINREVVDLYYNSYFLKSNVGKVHYESIVHDFEKIFEHYVFKNGVVSLISIGAKIFFHLIYANYYHVIKDKENELLSLEKVIDVFELHPVYKEENPLDYISVYIRIIDIYKKSENKIFYNKIDALRSFESILDFQRVVAKERIFFHTYQAELEFLIYNNQFDQALDLMLMIIKTLKENKFNIEPYYLIGMFYQFASILLVKKNFSQCLKYVNMILNDYSMEDRPKTYIKTEILNLLVHFELKNYKLVIHNYNSYLKKYRRVFKLNHLEKKTIRLVYEISENPYSKNENVEFKNLYNKILKREIEGESISDKIYLKFIVSKFS